MPVLKIEALDEEPLPDETSACTGGQVSNARRNLLAPNQWHGLVNVQLQASGPGVTRRGAQDLALESAGTDPVQGLGYFDIVTLQQLVRVKAGVVETHTGTTATAWTAQAGFAPDAAARMAMAQGINVLYLSNGVDNVRSWDGVTFVDLGTTPPKGRLAVWFTNRLIIAAVDGFEDTLYFSDILDGATGYDTSQRLRVGAGDGDPIVALVPWTKTLLAVFKRSSVHIVNADPSLTVGQMTIDEAPTPAGIAGRRAWAKTGRDVWFVSDNYQMRSLSRVLQGEDVEVAPALSYPIDDELALINRTHGDLICGTAHGNRVLFAVPTYSASQPDRVLVFNTQLQCWEGRWTGWQPTIFARSYFSGQNRLNFGQADGRVLQWRDYVPEPAETDDDYKDAGEEIATAMTTRNHTWNEAQNAKRALHAEIEFNPSRADLVTVTLIRDDVDDDAPTLTIGAGAGDPALGLPGVNRASLNLMHEAPAREWGLRIDSPAGKLSVRTVQWSAFIETVNLVAVPDFAALADAFDPGTPEFDDPATNLLPATTLDASGDMTANLTIVDTPLPATVLDGGGDMTVADLAGWTFTALDYDSPASEVAEATDGTWTGTAVDYDSPASEVAEATDGTWTGINGSTT